MIDQSLGLIFKLAIVIALGGLVGFEREHRHKEAGVRTFILISIVGFLSAYLSSFFGNWVFLISLMGALILASLSYHDHIYKKNHVGLTTVFAMVVMFFTGVIGYFDSYPPFLTVAMGIVLALVLVSKEYLHSFATKLRSLEITDGVIFGLFAFVILPLLPKAAIDPFGIFKPFYIWLFMVIVLGINFVSYIVMKMLGTKLGLELSGLLGGLVSSTSLTAAMSNKVSKNKSLLSVASFSSAIACTIMFLRILVVVLIANPNMAISLAIPMIIIAIVGFVSSFMLINEKRVKISTDIGSPLELKSALKFGVAFVFVLIIVNLIKIFFGKTGIYIASFVSGLTDVDAISLTLSSLTNIDARFVLIGVMIAAFANTMFKWLITRQIAGNEMFKYMTKYFIPVLATSILMIIMVSYDILPLLGNI